MNAIRATIKGLGLLEPQWKSLIHKPLIIFQFASLFNIALIRSCLRYVYINCYSDPKVWLQVNLEVLIDVHQYLFILWVCPGDTKTKPLR